MHEVMVTGIGVVAACGIGRDAWRAGLRQAPCVPALPARFAGELPVVEVLGLDIASLLPSVKTYLDRAAEFTLAAGQLALRDAGLPPEALPRWRAGVVMGSEFGCLDTMHTYTHTLQVKGARLANPLLFSHMYLNTPASLTAIEFGLGGHHGAFAGRDAGSQALQCAVDALRLGRADAILAIGVDVISEPLYRALAADGSLAEPLGEGACALLLETTAHAAGRGLPFPDTYDLTPIRQHLGHTHAAEPFFAVALALEAILAQPSA